MRFTKWTLYMFFVLSAGMAALSENATAQCIQDDTSVQVSITGSRTGAQQESDVQMNSQGPCTGSYTRTQGRQITVGGTGDVEQRRSVNQNITPGEGNASGINVPTVQTQSNPQIDVYNPAERIRR